MGLRARDELMGGSPKEWRYAPVPVQGGGGRTFPRFHFRTLATAIIHPIPGVGIETQVCYVLTRDLSRNGVSFMHPRKLDIGQRIEMAFQDGKQITAKVQHVKQLAQRCFLIGCKFTIVPDLDGKKQLARLNRK